MDAFFEFATEFADGERWKLLRSEGWEDFVERLAHAVGDLPPRRRQALMMLLFVLMEEFAAPEEVRAWLDEHDITTDAGVEEADHLASSAPSRSLRLTSARPRADEEVEPNHLAGRRRLRTPLSGEGFDQHEPPTPEVVGPGSAQSREDGRPIGHLNPQPIPFEIHAHRAGGCRVANRVGNNLARQQHGYLVRVITIPGCQYGPNERPGPIGRLGRCRKLNGGVQAAQSATSNARVGRRYLPQGRLAKPSDCERLCESTRTARASLPLRELLEQTCRLQHVGDKAPRRADDESATLGMKGLACMQQRVDALSPRTPARSGPTSPHADPWR